MQDTYFTGRNISECVSCPGTKGTQKQCRMFYIESLVRQKWHLGVTGNAFPYWNIEILFLMGGSTVWPRWVNTVGTLVKALTLCPYKSTPPSPVLKHRWERRRVGCQASNSSQYKPQTSGYFFTQFLFYKKHSLESQEISC